MIDRLESIDWANMGANHLPNWIIALTSTNQARREKAGLELLEYLGSYVESPSEYQKILATDAVVMVAPFVVDLLTSPHASDKATIISILEVLARYRSVNDLGETQQARASQVYQYLLKHFDLYPPFLNHQNSDTRTEAMALLSHFNEKSSLVVNLLLNQIETQIERDELAKQVIAEIVFRKIQYDESLATQFSVRFIQSLRFWMSSAEESLLVQATAANYLIQLMKNKVDVGAVDTLVRALTPPNHIECETETYVYINTLMNLGGQHGLNALSRILSAQTDIQIIFSVASKLLLLSFKGQMNQVISEVFVSRIGEKYRAEIFLTYATPLNDLQKNILTQLISKTEIWTTESNLLAVFGLPQSKPALQLLLDKN